MEEIARFVAIDTALFSGMIHKIGIIWIAVVQREAHEVIRFLCVKISVAIVVANRPIVEGVLAVTSTRFGDSVEC